MALTSAQLWDTVAILTLFDSVNRIARVDGNLKVQKLTFLAELEGQERFSLRAAHFRFFRYTYGPYSRRLANTVAGLESTDILTPGLIVTNRGRFILDYVKDSVSGSNEATEALELMRDTGKKFGRRTGAELKEYVYGLKVPVIDLDGERMKVKSIPTGTDIIDPDRNDSLVDVDPFDNEILNDIEEELAVPSSRLKPTSTSLRNTVAAALARIGA